MKINLKIAAIVAITAGSIYPADADIMWPADGDWVALKSGPSFYNDVASEINPESVDLVGTADSYSAGYWALVENGEINAGGTDDVLMFRMRVRGNGAGKHFVWQAHLNTDGVPSNVEWVFQLVQSGNETGVELIKTDIGGATLQDVSTVADNVWLGDLNIYSRWTPALENTDYHVDFAVPWSTFSNATGLSSIDNVQVVLSTSTAHNQTNKDAPLGAALTDQISSVLSDSIPEPAVITLLLGAGGGILGFRRVFKKKS